MTYLMHHVSLM